MFIFSLPPGKEEMLEAMERMYEKISGSFNVKGKRIAIKLHFWKTDSHPQWNATTDASPDSVIDIYDMVFVAIRFT